MPDLDGVSAIQEIHQHQPNIQIITLSKFAEESLVRQARQAGAVGNVQLGDSADSIVTTIRNVYVNATREQQSQDTQNTESSSR
jgi:DNA-binding NarL/FixJ family response regulator